MTINYPLSDAECLEMCREHVAYEVQMLNYCVLRIDGSKSQQQNLYAEGFALHLRNLLEFLYKPIPKEPKFDDLRALHFINSDTWLNIRGEMSPILQDAENRANKQLAHLTLSRQRKEPWEYMTILKTLVPVLKRLVSHARQELLHEALRSEIESLEKTIATARVAITCTTTSTSFASTSFGRSSIFNSEKGTK